MGTTAVSVLSTTCLQKAANKSKTPQPSGARRGTFFGPVAVSRRFPANLPRHNGVPAFSDESHGRGAHAAEQVPETEEKGMMESWTVFE